MHWRMTAVRWLGAGCAAVYAGLARLLRHAVAERQREMERRISAMAMTLKALQARVAELGRSQAERGSGNRGGERDSAEATRAT